MKMTGECGAYAFDQTAFIIWLRRSTHALWAPLSSPWLQTNSLGSGSSVHSISIDYEHRLHAYAVARLEQDARERRLADQQQPLKIRSGRSSSHARASCFSAFRSRRRPAITPRYCPRTCPPSCAESPVSRHNADRRLQLTAYGESPRWCHAFSNDTNFANDRAYGFGGQYTNGGLLVALPICRLTIRA